MEGQNLDEGACNSITAGQRKSHVTKTDVKHGLARLPRGGRKPGHSLDYLTSLDSSFNVGTIQTSPGCRSALDQHRVCTHSRHVS